MRISAKTNYACRALLELCLHWPNHEPLHVTHIAQRQKIPMKFLTHILINLKQLGYVQSSRGKKGGYSLAKLPKDIRLSDVVKDFSHVSFKDEIKKTQSKSEDVFEAIWAEFDASLIKFLSSVTFEEICNRCHSLESIPMYTI